MTTNSNGNSLLIQGRIVWTSGNSLFEGKHRKNMNTNQLEYDDKGQPVIEYGFGLAVPKIDPRTNQFTAEYVKIYQAIHGEALTLYPSGQLPPNFALKYKDGDGVDHNGAPFNTREGYAGHIVLACTTRIPIKFFRFEGNQNILVNDGIKCGDYVNVQLNIKAHPAKGQSKPGVYLNPSAVQLIQPGKEIINMPSGDQMFGNAAPQYAGEVVAPTHAPMPNMGAGQNLQAPPAMPGQGFGGTPPAGTHYAPQPAPAPHYGVLPQTHQPAPQAAPPMPGMPPVGNGHMGQPGNAVGMPGTPYGQPNSGNMSAPPAYPSNPGMPPMPGMPR